MEVSETDNSIHPKIATLVFMDLESTGLPSDVGARNVQITEMSLVAVDRHDFEVDKNFRILNKMSLCIRPRSVISPVSMTITGLYNDILQSQKEFDDSVPKLLEYFFRRLQKPICLLAHNGNRFDFPVLQAELKRLNYALGSDIVCADTLVAFRSICNLKKEAEAQKLAAEEEKLKLNEAAAITDDDVDDLLSQDLDSFTGIDTELFSKDYEVLQPEISKNQPSEKKTVEGEKATHPVVTSEFNSHALNDQTPQKQIVPSDQIEETKIKKKRKILDPTYKPQTQYKKKIKVPIKHIPAKRVLFPEYDPSSFEIHKITKFSLQNLYNHFFQETPPNSHYAEVDTISLSKVCQKINQDFLQWIDENYVVFDTINPLW